MCLVVWRWWLTCGAWAAVGDWGDVFLKPGGICMMTLEAKYDLIYLVKEPPRNCSSLQFTGSMVEEVRINHFSPMPSPEARNTRLLASWWGAGFIEGRTLGRTLVFSWWPTRTLMQLLLMCPVIMVQDYELRCLQLQFGIHMRNMKASICCHNNWTLSVSFNYTQGDLFFLSLFLIWWKAIQDKHIRWELLHNEIVDKKNMDLSSYECIFIFLSWVHTWSYV